MSETGGNHGSGRAGQLLFAIAGLLVLGLGLRLGTVAAAATRAQLDPAAEALAVSAAPLAGSLVCNGQPVAFEEGIPVDWTVVSNSPGGIEWTTTADPACGIPNLTVPGRLVEGEAACADSDAAGSGAPPYDTELVSNPFDLSAFGAVVLEFYYYYNDITTRANDRFEVDVWDGTSWNNELSWDEDHTDPLPAPHQDDPFSVNLSAYGGLSEVRVRFRYFGDGNDWYAQVDDVGLSCTATSPPAIEVDPAALTELLGPDLVSTQILTITNAGGSPLHWNIVEDDSLCDSPADIPWLSVAPNAGATVPLANTLLDVTFDSTGLARGDYSASLCVNSDDPATPLVLVPVTLMVWSPEYYLECNGDTILFEDGIPHGWPILDNTGGTGIVWADTADPACEIPNRTNGSGEAACADSDAAGTPSTPYDTELWTNLIDLAGWASAMLDVKAYYRDMNEGTNDRFEVDVWNGSIWSNELSWDENHEPEDFSLDLSAYIGAPEVRVRFRYRGNGFDWYAQVDDVALTCIPPSPPVIEVEPSALAWSQPVDVVSVQPMTVTNSGGSPLNWSIAEAGSACDSPGDVPWLSAAPNSGATVAQSSTAVEVTLDSTGLTPGDYGANLCVNSDDPVTPVVQLPVTLTVLPPDDLECNDGAVTFEGGIPSGWEVVDNTYGLGIEWTTTADPACSIPNRTGASGEAACADSQAAATPGVPYDTELRTNLIDLTGWAAAVLDVKAYYLDLNHGTNDHLEVDLWDGSAWINELIWDEDHTPGDLTLDLAAYIGEPEVRVRFRYHGNGLDWYAQVDDVALTCATPGPPVVGVDPGALTWLQDPDLISTHPLTITNSGSSPLNWEILEDDASCDSPADVPWLSVAPNAGATAPLDGTAVGLVFDSTGLVPGDYLANLCINSDDPVTPLVQMPVALTVRSPCTTGCMIYLPAVFRSLP